MSIKISIHGIESQFDNYDADAIPTELESIALEAIGSEFKKRGLDFGEIRFRRRSDKYLTLLAPNDFDFCRIKVGERSVWFSVHGIKLPAEIKNDSRFDGVKKTLVHWKVSLKNVSDFQHNSDLIAESYLSIRDFG